MLKKTVDKIIEIDNSTKEIVESSKDEIKRIKDDLRKRMSEMETNQLEAAKKIAQEKYNSIISQAEAEVKKRREENQKNLKKIDENYEKNKNFLVEKALEDFILKAEV